MVYLPTSLVLPDFVATHHIDEDLMTTCQPTTIQDSHFSGQIIIFHQPRFPWNAGISLP